MKKQARLGIRRWELILYLSLFGVIFGLAFGLTFYTHFLF